MKYSYCNVSVLSYVCLKTEFIAAFYCFLCLTVLHYFCCVCHLVSQTKFCIQLIVILIYASFFGFQVISSNDAISEIIVNMIAIGFSH